MTDLVAAWLKNPELVQRGYLGKSMISHQSFNVACNPEWQEVENNREWVLTTATVASAKTPKPAVIIQAAFRFYTVLRNKHASVHEQRRMPRAGYLSASQFLICKHCASQTVVADIKGLAGFANLAGLQLHRILVHARSLARRKNSSRHPTIQALKMILKVRGRDETSSTAPPSACAGTTAATPTPTPLESNKVQCLDVFFAGLQKSMLDPDIDCDMHLYL